MFERSVFERRHELLPHVLQNILGVGVARHSRADEPHEPLPGITDDPGDVVFMFGGHEISDLSYLIHYVG